MEGFASRLWGLEKYSSGMLVRMFITASTSADCSQVCTLVKGINAENMLADKGYDSDNFVERLEEKALILSFHHAKIVRNSDSMTNISIGSSTSLKIPFLN